MRNDASTIQGSTRAHAITATVNYLAPMAALPVFCGPDAPGTNLVYDPRLIEVHNARALGVAPSLEREGFSLVDHRSSVPHFLDRDMLDGQYGLELADLVETLTGARLVRVVPGSTGRVTDRRASTPAANTLPAARFVHWDYTDHTARTVFLPQISRIIGMSLHSIARRFSRICLYQTWRALSGPMQDVPLALADARTVAEHDLITCKLREAPGVAAQNSRYADGNLGEFSLSRYNSKHRWYFYPEMRRDELLVFKGYEYDPQRQLRVLHTAFDHPEVPPDTPPRTSVEVRLFAFFE